MPRLAGAVLGLAEGVFGGPSGLGAAGASADFSLRFERDSDGRFVVRGRVQARLVLQCQRCLGPMIFDVDRPILLAFVHNDEQAIALPDAYDPWVVREDLVNAQELVEDELLLALPAVPRHPAEDGCAEHLGAAAPPVGRVSVDTDADVREARRPFAVLASIKTPTRH
jgi:uncharacterized protein